MSSKVIRGNRPGPRCKPFCSVRPQLLDRFKSYVVKYNAKRRQLPNVIKRLCTRDPYYAVAQTQMNVPSLRLVAYWWAAPLSRNPLLSLHKALTLLPTLGSQMSSSMLPSS